MSRKRKDQRARISPTSRHPVGPHQCSNNPPRAVEVEPLEDRRLAGGMVAAAPGGILLATDPALDPTLFDSESRPDALDPAAAPAALPPEADPLSPVGDPARGTRSAPAVYASSCCGSGGSYTAYVWFEYVADASEANPATPGAFRFHATAQTCTGAILPSSITVNLNLEGDAIPGTDYDGPLADGRVTVPLNPVYDYIMDKYSEGQVDETFNAIDEELDEQGYETVLCSIRTAIDNLGRGVLWEVGQEGAHVFSGDYTGRILHDGQEVESMELDDGVENPDDPFEVPNGIPHRDDVSIEITNFGNPVPGVAVMLENGGATDAMIENNDPEWGPGEMHIVIKTTGADGKATFTLIGKRGAAGIEGNIVVFTASWANAEGDRQSKSFDVHVRPKGR